MELLQLKYFCTVARLENISQAAREHMVPQPAMSRTISRLEKELNTQLFERKGNRILLTDQGKLFYSHVDRALLSLSDAMEAIQQTENAADIYLLLNTNRNIIFKFIADFTKRHPSANIIIDHNNSAETLAAMGHGGLHHHLCVTALPVDPEFNKGVSLLQERLMIAVHRDSPLAGQSSVSFADLAKERFVLLAKRFRMHTTFLDHCHLQGFEPNISMYCSDPSYVRQAVDSGLGISVMPELSWHESIGPNTVLVRLEDDSLWQTHRILWNSNRYLSPLAATFRDELIAHYRKEFGGQRPAFP